MVDDGVHRGGIRKGAGRKALPGRMRPVNFSSLIKAANSPRPKCGYIIHFRSQGDHYKNLAFSAYCGSWACPQCNKYNKKKWIDHIKCMTLLNVEGILSSSAFLFEITSEEWESSIKKRLSRQNVDFARIRLANGRLAVVNNGNNGEFFSDDRFDSALASIFDAVGYDRKPVSTSKRWRLATKKPSFKWDRLNNLYLTLPELKDELQKLGARTEYTQYSNGIIFEYPNSWTEEMIMEKARYLASIPSKEKQ